MGGYGRKLKGGGEVGVLWEVLGRGLLLGCGGLVGFLEVMVEKG